jgi:hypothetical protein
MVQVLCQDGFHVATPSQFFDCFSGLVPLVLRLSPDAVDALPQTHDIVQEGVLKGVIASF